MQTSGDGSFGTLPQIAADIAARIRANRPAVHCITNTVAQNFTANMVLAIGATPSMTLSVDEIASFVVSSDALLVNLGTFDPERRATIDIAVSTAAEGHKPWVLDPVFIERSPLRAVLAHDWAGRKPAVIRLNRAEFRVLSGKDASPETLAAYADKYATVIALSGATDLVVDAKRRIMIGNGHPMMAQVTAMGCAISAITAACLAVESDPVTASAAALLMAGVAGEIAAEQAHGPGSFAVVILDALSNLDAAGLQHRAKVM
jgi:hydroxyethylthiazole kinase